MGIISRRSPPRNCQRSDYPCRRGRAAVVDTVRRPVFDAAGRRRLVARTHRSILGGTVVAHAEGAVVVVDRHYAVDRSHGRSRIGDIVETLQRGADALGRSSARLAGAARSTHGAADLQVRPTDTRSFALSRSRNDRPRRRRRDAGLPRRLRGDRRRRAAGAAIPAAGLRTREGAARRSRGMGRESGHARHIQWPFSSTCR